MQAILIKVTHKKTKPICGDILQDGLNRITLAVIDKSGSKSIKSFCKSDYIVKYQTAQK